MVLKTFFSGGPIDRAAHLRTDPTALAQAWQEPSTGIVAIWHSRCLVRNNAAVLLRPAALNNKLSFENSIYLGKHADQGQHIFAAPLGDDPAFIGLEAEAFTSFRSLLSNLSPADAALLAYAKGMVEWHQRHRYCGICGSPNRTETGGFATICSNPECAQRGFPRIDPAIIVLVTDGDRCLLGRHADWPPDRYSTIAGFVEPGEALEDAVAREVLEESNIAVGHAEYLGSQPWPFPGAIMIGFRATATSTTIALNDGELAAAGWFSRADFMTRKLALPPVTSIAFRLIENWFDEWDGPALQSLNLNTDFARRDPAKQ